MHANVHRGPFKRIIYVDDDFEYGTFVSVGLRRLGHSVVYFSNPGDALKLLALDPGQWDGVVTDLHLISANGAQFADLIASRYPGLQCLVVSNDEDAVSASGAGAARAILAKPGSIEGLQEMVASLSRVPA